MHSGKDTHHVKEDCVDEEDFVVFGRHFGSRQRRISVLQVVRGVAE